MKLGVVLSSAILLIIIFLAVEARSSVSEYELNSNVLDDYYNDYGVNEWGCGGHSYNVGGTNTIILGHYADYPYYPGCGARTVLKRGLLKITNFSELPQNVKNVKLRLKFTTSIDIGKITPALTSVGNNWYELDITNYYNNWLQGGNNYLELRAVPCPLPGQGACSTGPFEFYASESNYKPKLIIEIEQVCIDNDGDGYGENCLLGNDCDDNNALVHATISCNYNGLSCGNCQLCLSSCPIPPVEVCDGIDNDCDLLIDEGNVCFVCEPGQTQNRNCGTNIGQCEYGQETRTCNSQGQWQAWSECLGGINPIEETCDGIDNDCDGSVDEGGVCELSECTQDSNCTSDYFGANYCSMNKVYHDFHDFSCIQGGCVENVSSQLVENCSFGCNNGTCLPEPPECVVNGDCSSGKICQQGECVPVECITNSDCIQFNIALISTCNYNPDNNEFSLDYFPGFDSVCQSNTCTRGQISLSHSFIIGQCGVECLSNSDCGGNQLCQNYVCEENGSLLGPNCSELLDIIEDSWHSECGENNYDERADFNNDCIVNHLDLFEFSANSDDEEWCANNLEEEEEEDERKRGYEDKFGKLDDERLFEILSGKAELQLIQLGTTEDLIFKKEEEVNKFWFWLLLILVVLLVLIILIIYAIRS